MTEFTKAPAVPPAPCERFEAQVGEWCGRALPAHEEEWMRHHHESCASCAQLRREFAALIAEARALPPLSPPRDLWSSIEARLDAPVIAFDGRPPLTVLTRRRTSSVRTLALAATVLVAVSSGVTWHIARRTQNATGPSNAVPQTSTAITPAPTASTAGIDDADVDRGALAWATVVMSNTAVARPVTRRTANGGAGADLANGVYDQEIQALRSIVDDRFAELDSVTVRALKANLAIIDAAIRDSRRALARDPRSGLLATQLDRSLEAKLALLRQVALL